MQIKVNECNGCAECHHCGRNITRSIEVCDRCQDAPIEVELYGLELCRECAEELEEKEQ